MLEKDRALTRASTVVLKTVGKEGAGAPDLSGRRVLVAEDDYYLAHDTARALRDAGAEVLGPFPNEDAALDALTATRPNVAVVDVNLGDGPSFRLARALQSAGVPFAFLTGYEAGVIPDEFRGVLRLEKPVMLKRVIEAVARATIPPR